jgi:hypothetical protein
LFFSRLRLLDYLGQSDTGAFGGDWKNAGIAEEHSRVLANFRFAAASFAHSRGSV